MKDKSITVEDYEKYSGEFFDKYFYVAKQLGEGAKAEDILKIMESLGAVVMKKRMEDEGKICLLYTSPSPRDLSTSRMPSSA